MKTINTLRIKGMVCARCMKVVFEELSLLGIEIDSITLDEVSFLGELPANIDAQEVKNTLQKYGFDLLSDKKEALVILIKLAVAEAIVKQFESKNTILFSVFLSRELNMDYPMLSAVFSELEEMTLEKYIITQRILKVKDLLLTTDKSLTVISDELGFSSVSHLSRQLKSYTGFDTYHFKNLRKNSAISQS